MGKVTRKRKHNTYNKKNCGKCRVEKVVTNNATWGVSPQEIVNCLEEIIKYLYYDYRLHDPKYHGQEMFFKKNVNSILFNS